MAGGDRYALFVPIKRLLRLWRPGWELQNTANCLLRRVDGFSDLLRGRPRTVCNLFSKVELIQYQFNSVRVYLGREGRCPKKMHRVSTLQALRV